MLTDILFCLGDETFVGSVTIEVDSMTRAEVGCESIIPSLPKEAWASFVSIGSSLGLLSKFMNNIYVSMLCDMMKNTTIPSGSALSSTGLFWNN